MKWSPSKGEVEFDGTTLTVDKVVDVMENLGVDLIVLKDRGPWPELLRHMDSVACGVSMNGEVLREFFACVHYESGRRKRARR